MKTIKIITVLITLLILFTMDVCAEKTGKITLGCEASLLTSSVWVAENKGYFQDEGIEVNIKAFDSGRTALNAMLEEGNLDMVTVAQTPVALNSFTRNDYAIIAAMVSSGNDVKVIARKDKGINAARDLKGKKIGMTQGSTGHYFLYVFLLHNRIGFSEVEIVNLKTLELASALNDGIVDAISTWEPHVSNAKKLLGANATILKSKDIYREDFYFVPNRNFLKNNPQALEKFLRAIQRAGDFMQKNREEAIGIVSRRLKIDRGLAAAVWPDFDFGLFLDQTILITLEDESRWAVKNNLTDKTALPNYLDFIDTNILKKVAPDKVTIIE